MAVRGGAQIKITGNVTEALAALDRLGIRAAEVGKETESKLGGAAEKTGGLFGKLGNLGASFGLPFSESLSKMGEKFKDVEGHGASFGAKLAEVGKVATMAGVAGFGVVAAESIKLGENYQQATAQIAASSGQTIQSAQAVANQFLKTGFASTFSAQEIATAYGGVAGQLKATEGHALSAGDAMTVMQSSMDLAEASGQSLGGTTQALAATMQAYGLKTKDASKAADQLYNISVLTNQPILGLAQVLDRLKGRLGALAPSLSDVGTLMAFPSVAAQGSRGAMVVNTALTTLLGGSKNVSKELKSLGVSIFNSSGKFIGMRGVIAQLEPKLKGMSDQQRMLAEKTLFGSSAAQLMGTIIRGGVAGYDKAAAAVNRLGSAHDAAEKQSNTLHGQTEKLKAGLEDLGVRLGEFLIPKLEKLGEIVSKTVGWFEKHKAAAIALAAIVGGALTVAFGAWAASLFMTGGALAPLIGPLGLIVVAVAAIGVAVYELYNNWSTVWDGIKSVALAVWNDGLKPVFDAIKNTVATVVGWVKEHWKILAAALAVVLGPIGLVGAAIYELYSHWQTIWAGIKSVLQDGWNFVKQVFGWWETIAIDPIITLVHTLGSVWGTIWSGIKTAVSDVWKFIKPIFDAIVSAINDIIGLWGKVAGFIGSIPGLFTGNGPDKGGNGDYTINRAALAKIPDLSKLGNLSNLSKLHIPGHAVGGFVQDGWFTSGEHGPEVGYKSGSQVQMFSNGSPQTTQMLNPQGGGQTINIAVNGDVSNPNQFASELAWQLRPYMNGR